MRLCNTDERIVVHLSSVVYHRYKDKVDDTKKVLYIFYKDYYFSKLSFALMFTLNKILYIQQLKPELLNQLLIKSLNQTYYLVDSTKQFSFY